MTGRCAVRQGKAGQYKAGQGRTGQSKAVQGGAGAGGAVGGGGGGAEAVRVSALAAPGMVWPPRTKAELSVHL